MKLRLLDALWVTVSSLQNQIVPILLQLAVVGILVPAASFITGLGATGLFILFPALCPDDPLDLAWIITPPMWVVLALCSCNLAISSSRWLLYRERMSVVQLFRWGNRQTRMLGVGLAVALLAWLATSVVGLMGVATGLIESANAWIGRSSSVLDWVFLAIDLTILSRFGCLIPIIAGDEAGRLQARWWRLTSGNWFKVLAGIVLICGVVVLSSYGLWFAYRAISNVVPDGAIWSATALSTMVLMLAPIGMSTFLTVVHTSLSKSHQTTAPL